jgi:predicted esterase YcpF (UPF0227 family)
MAVLGSSLGGFYATAGGRAPWLPGGAAEPGRRPGARPGGHIGEQTAFHDPAERFFFRAEFIDELRALTVPAASPGPSATWPSSPRATRCSTGAR